jgi:hypothetical protein
MTRWIAGLFLASTVVATAAERQQLFNGKDLTGWARIPRHEDSPKDQQPGFRIENGLLVSLPEAPEDDLWYTPAKLGNGTLRVVYKVSDKTANSGIFIRIPDKPKSEDDAINKGIEVQIGDTADDYHTTGVLYSMTQAKARPSRPAGEWNTLEIAMKGPRTVVTLNGVVVTDYDGRSTTTENLPFPRRRAATNRIAVRARTPDSSPCSTMAARRQCGSAKSALLRISRGA